MSLIRKCVGLGLLCCVGVLAACNPVALPEQEQVEETGFKPPPQIVLMPIPPEGLTEEQAEERREARRWNSIYVCFRCHEMSERVISQQPRRRQKKHRKAMSKRRSCLDCHNQTDVRCCHDLLFPKIESWK